MVLRRPARVAAALFLLVICVACGDTFRPVAVPITPPPPNPAASHFVLVINGNGVGATNKNPGSSTRIDVSGDTNVGVAQLGPGPVHAALLPNSNTVYVVNRLENTVSSFVPTTISPVTTTSLPPGSDPVFVHTTENATVYVANAGTNAVAAISTANNAVTNLITLGAQDTGGVIHSFTPNTLAETPDGKKVYAVGSDSSGVGWVISINSLDKSLNEATTGQAIPNVTTHIDSNINAPVWAVARADSARVYVLNSGSGTVSVIDTTTDAVVGSASVGGPANCIGQPQMCGFLLYDKARTRLYVTNPKSTTVVVLDASSDALMQLPAVNLTTAPNSVCAGGCFPASIAVLPDGSRAYVASYQFGIDPMNGNPTISAGVTVFSTTGNTVTTTIELGSVDIDTTDPTGCDPTGPPLRIPPARFRLSAVAAADGTKVYVSGCDGLGNPPVLGTNPPLDVGSTAIIRTTPDRSTGSPADSLVLNLPAPASGFLPSTVDINAVSQSGSNTTYTYTPITGPPLQVGMNILVTSIVTPQPTPTVDDGTFTITAIAPGAFTVVNPSGVAATGQNGSGTVPTSQNPVFILAGP
jgi:YVTN family beta-propeller protein